MNYVLYIKKQKQLTKAIKTANDTSMMICSVVYGF